MISRAQPSRGRRPLRTRREPLSPKPLWKDIFLEPRYHPDIQLEIDDERELDIEPRRDRRRKGWN
ncbi:hypothetical protein ABZ502_16845 [Streptomyces abikoensis]|uniref:hypothetical protein n=1 Tax=Streptomyces abikoensis TaxID=97398 RepID=UPI00340D8E06